MKIKKPFLFLFFLIFLFSIFVLNAQLAFAQETKPSRLELNYPKFPGFYTPETVEFPLPDYVKYIYNFVILASGLLALGVLVFAGFGYLTSAGSPEKIKEAKGRIAGALLGLVILFGSHLLLESINPQLTIFHLRSLVPMISELTPGVLLCKGESAADPDIWAAWGYIEEFKKPETTDKRKRKLKELLDPILKDISQKCYTVKNKGNIRSDFEDKVTYVWFIPGEWEHYGAILYETRKYEGLSYLMYQHLGRTDMVPLEEFELYVGELDYLREMGVMGVSLPLLQPQSQPVPQKLGVSSIKPFMTKFMTNQDWEVVLYEQTDQNKGFPPETKKIAYKLDMEDPTGWWEPMWFKEVEAPLFPDGPKLSPKSIEVKGDLLAILFKPREKDENMPWPIAPEKAHNATFFAEIDVNLENNYEIVTWVPCKEYKSRYTKEVVGEIIWGVTYQKYCAKAAAKTLYIINAVSY